MVDVPYYFLQIRGLAQSQERQKVTSEHDRGSLSGQLASVGFRSFETVIAEANASSSGLVNH
jgi:hypothetical protein